MIMQISQCNLSNMTHKSLHWLKNAQNLSFVSLFALYKHSQQWWNFYQLTPDDQGLCETNRSQWNNSMMGQVQRGPWEAILLLWNHWRTNLQKRRFGWCRRVSAYPLGEDNNDAFKILIGNADNHFMPRKNKDFAYFQMSWLPCQN